MRKKRQLQQQNRASRLSFCSPQMESVFELVKNEKIDELISFISKEENQIWNYKKSESITLLHNACILDKTKVVETIIEQTKKRLHLLPEDSSLEEEEKTKNLQIFKEFINAKTEGDNLTALHYASFRGNIEIIKLLIANQAEINLLSTHGLHIYIF